MVRLCAPATSTSSVMRKLKHDALASSETEMRTKRRINDAQTMWSSACRKPGLLPEEKVASSLLMRCRARAWRWRVDSKSAMIVTIAMRLRPGFLNMLIIQSRCHMRRKDSILLMPMLHRTLANNSLLAFCIYSCGQQRHQYGSWTWHVLHSCGNYK